MDTVLFSNMHDVVDIAESRKADQRFQIWGGGVMIAFYG
jgi:hypothetical protein